ncbi:hypothetical protein TNCV_2213971 [Trichonephila clavipes]|nr:hypothetical protein TNCV_2213971 [Trichonephila clavipes]
MARVTNKRGLELGTFRSENEYLGHHAKTIRHSMEAITGLSRYQNHTSMDSEQNSASSFPLLLPKRLAGHWFSFFTGNLFS